MADDHTQTTKPPLNLLSLPVLSKLGTVSTLTEKHEKHSQELQETVKQNALKEKEGKESKGFGGRWEEDQQIVPPGFDDNLKGFKIEMAFSYLGDEGEQFWGWYNGILNKLVNAKKHIVFIE